MIKEEAFFPATKWTYIGEDICWRPSRHWAMNTYAGEGLYHCEGDRSGCIQGELHKMKVCSVPTIVQSRIYRLKEREVSALLSYPNGIDIEDKYFWEIYDYHEIIERYFSEEEMEQRVKEILREHDNGKQERRKRYFV